MQPYYENLSLVGTRLEQVKNILLFMGCLARIFSHDGPLPVGQEVNCTTPG